jgi:hypothetical protein
MPITDPEIEVGRITERQVLDRAGDAQRKVSVEFRVRGRGPFMVSLSSRGLTGEQIQKAIEDKAAELKKVIPLQAEE